MPQKTKAEPKELMKFPNQEIRVIQKLILQEVPLKAEIIIGQAITTEIIMYNPLPEFIHHQEHQRIQVHRIVETILLQVQAETILQHHLLTQEVILQQELALHQLADLQALAILAAEVPLQLLLHQAIANLGKDN